jgi:hypothetical protein
VWIATTVAPATVEPSTSVILPLIDEVVTCAKDATATNKHIAVNANNLIDCLIRFYIILG